MNEFHVVGVNKVESNSKKMILLHTVTDLRGKVGSFLGQAVEVFYIKPDYSEELVGCPYVDIKLSDFMDKDITVDRNRKGYPCSISILDDK